MIVKRNKSQKEFSEGEKFLTGGNIAALGITLAGLGFIIYDKIKSKKLERTEKELSRISKNKMEEFKEVAKTTIPEIEKIAKINNISEEVKDGFGYNYLTMDHAYYDPNIDRVYDLISLFTWDELSESYGYDIKEGSWFECSSNSNKYVSFSKIKEEILGNFEDLKIKSKISNIIK